MEGYATLNEMRTLYDLEDVFDMNLAISLKAKVQERVNKKD